MLLQNVLFCTEKCWLQSLNHTSKQKVAQTTYFLKDITAISAHQLSTMFIHHSDRDLKKCSRNLAIVFSASNRRCCKTWHSTSAMKVADLTTWYMLAICKSVSLQRFAQQFLPTDCHSIFSCSWAAFIWGLVPSAIYRDGLYIYIYI